MRSLVAAAVVLVCLLASAPCASAKSNPLPSSQQGAGAPNANQSAIRDGSHDFDFNAGRWATHISRLAHPLSGSSTWVQLTGTVDIQSIWGGKAQIEQIEADGPSGHFEGLTLYLYNPEAHQWSVNFANSSDGVFSQPAIGEFRNGSGEFYDQEQYQGRAILVRIIWSHITPTSHKFEQSFSEDGGKTWETNFVADLTRVEGDAALAPRTPAAGDPGQHAFDWDLGTWETHQKRLLHPLAGSTTWVEYQGTDVVRALWGGRANVGVIEGDGPAGHLELLGMRLYNPNTHLWSIYFANSAAGTLSPPSVGEIKNGRGDFYGQESFHGRPILVRFSVSDITSNSVHFEQAFSADWGKTWEVNFIVPETRLKGGASAGQ